jgi:hypothetical protein
VAPNTTAIHREIDSKVRTFHLTNATTPERTNRIVQALRTVVLATDVTLSAQDEIEIRDTFDKITLAEQVILELDRPAK